MRPFAIVLALFGVLFAALAAASSGGAVTVPGGGWLLPAAVACLGLSWLLTLLG